MKKKIMYYYPMGKCFDDFIEFNKNIRLSIWLESSANLCSVCFLFSLSACQQMIHFNELYFLSGRFYQTVSETRKWKTTTLSRAST